MWTVTVSSKEHANAIVKYVAEIGCTGAKISYDDLRKWYHVEVECELRYRRQIAGFADGLEWYGDNHSIGGE